MRIKLNGKAEIYLIAWFCFVSYWDIFNITSYSAVLKLFVVSVIPALYLLASRKINFGYPEMIWLLFVVLYTVQIFIGNIKVTTGIAWSLQKLMVLFIMIWLVNACTHIDKIIDIFSFFSMLFAICTIGEYFVPNTIHLISRMILPASGYSVIEELNMYGYHSGIAMQVSYNACYIAISMMIFFSLLIGKVKKYNKYGFWQVVVGMMISVVAMILTGKRGMLAAAIVAIVLGGLLVIIFKKGIEKVKPLITGVALYIFGMNLFLRTDVAENIIRRMKYTDDFLTGRSDIWSIMLEGISRHPIVGNGSASFSMVSEISGHNAFLQIWYENGLIGLLLVAFFMIYGILYCLKQYKKNYKDDSVNYIILLSFMYQIYFIVACFTDSMFYHNTSLLCYFVIYLLPIIALRRRNVS